MKKRLLFFSSIMFELSFLFISCETVKTALPFLDNEPDPPQSAEIKAKWKEYKPSSMVKTFEAKPSIEKPYATGALSPDFLNN
jgi:hypothetical protein